MAAVTSAAEIGPRHADDVWVAVDEGAAVATARRRAATVAAALGLPEERVGEVEIVASELATNLVKHAGGGDLVVRSTPSGGVQLLAIDSGPGTRDLEALIDDGVSTAGTLGVGLGAVRRLATRLRVWAEPARGAVVVAEIAGADEAEDPVGRLVRTLRGETVCGDVIATRRTARGWLLMVADGLGHGTLAAEPARRAAVVLESSVSEDPRDLVQRMHSALGGTRGAAVAVSRVDLDSGVLTHAAVGNISGRLVGAGQRPRTLISQPGIVGHRLPRVVENRHQLDDVDLVVLHSDGLTEKWDAATLPVPGRHGATVCAAVLLRDAGTRRDDASVLALRVTS
ncbi:SpoIIE family protein phosphatase [Nocardioides pyridinolyticus]